MMPHPPADALPAAFEFYRYAGVSVVLSMLPDDEVVELGLEAEAARAAQVGVQYLTHPIPDFGLPDMDDFAALIDHIKGLVVAGEHVAVHCRAGIGRSGMVAASTLCALGDNAADAMRGVHRFMGFPF